MKEFEKEPKEQYEDKGVSYPYQTFMSLPTFGRFVNMTRPGKLKENESKIIILMYSRYVVRRIKKEKIKNK